MADLTEFLLARIAEDETLAKAATPAPWTHTCEWGHRDLVHYVSAGGDELACVYEDDSVGEFEEATAQHMARHDPARVLSECEAKRRLLSWLNAWQADVAHEGLSLLALPYADHPDYPR